MAVAPPSTHHSHLDPSDLRLRLTSRSSYGSKYRSTVDPTYNPKEKNGDHITRSGSYYRRDPSVEESTNSSPELVVRAETPRRSTHRKRAPESHLFQKHFISSRSRRKNSGSLLNIVQEKNESLACFLGRFNAATLEIDNLDESVKYTAFLQGLRPTSKFAFSMNKSPPGNIKSLLEKANKYIQAEEYLETHRGRRGEGKEEQKKRSREITPPEGKSAKCSKHDEWRPKDPFAWEKLTTLNAKPSQILHEIKDNKALQWPDKMKSRPNKRNKDLWCYFHNDHGHTTDDCGSLK
ncbi:hypothetical protein RJ639_021739 [Escallonia herrerae]|uniref:Retrotransposon gag domain-containing protein n=1 Tax=Escallonia herrerae TaxID=1293975 RepID=A0AA88V7S7_9ASTE|nr:hypothetical protein RJ639_021739 [Escallonia herrerae]